MLQSRPRSDIFWLVILIAVCALGVSWRYRPAAPCQTIAIEATPAPQGCFSHCQTDPPLMQYDPHLVPAGARDDSALMSSGKIDLKAGSTVETFTSSETTTVTRKSTPYRCY